MKHPVFFVFLFIVFQSAGSVTEGDTCRGRRMVGFAGGIGCRQPEV